MLTNQETTALEVDQRKRKVYVFPSTNREHIEIGVANSCWAVRDNDVPNYSGKAQRIRPGDLGIFYCSAGARKGYFCYPFTFLTRPSNAQAAEMQRLWKGGPFGWGFKLQVIGTGSEVFPYASIQGLRTVIEYRGQWNNVLLVAPRLTFVPVTMYESDWIRILETCSPEGQGLQSHLP